MRHHTIRPGCAAVARRGKPGSRAAAHLLHNPHDSPPPAALHEHSHAHALAASPSLRPWTNHGCSDMELNIHSQDTTQRPARSRLAICAAQEGMASNPTVTPRRHTADESCAAAAFTAGCIAASGDSAPTLSRHSLTRTQHAYAPHPLARKWHQCKSHSLPLHITLVGPAAPFRLRQPLSPDTRLPCEPKHAAAPGQLPSWLAARGKTSSCCASGSCTTRQHNG